MTLILRNFTQQDSDAVNFLLRSAWAEYAAVMPGWTDLAARLGTLVDKATTSEVIVAELDGQVVGAVGYVPANAPKPDFFQSDWPIVRLMSVAPKTRGLGVGRKLLEECIKRARRDRAPALALHTTPVMGDAQSLYRSAGFELFQTLPDMFGVHYVLLIKPLVYSH